MASPTPQMDWHKAGRVDADGNAEQFAGIVRIADVYGLLAEREHDDGSVPDETGVGERRPRCAPDDGGFPVVEKGKPAVARIGAQKIRSAGLAQEQPVFRRARSARKRGGADRAVRFHLYERVAAGLDDPDVPRRGCM